MDCQITSRVTLELVTKHTDAVHSLKGIYCLGNEQNRSVPLNTLRSAAMVGEADSGMHWAFNAQGRTILAVWQLTEGAGDIIFGLMDTYRGYSSLKAFPQSFWINQYRITDQYPFLLGVGPCFLYLHMTLYFSNMEQTRYLSSIPYRKRHSTAQNFSIAVCMSVQGAVWGPNSHSHEEEALAARVFQASAPLSAGIVFLLFSEIQVKLESLINSAVAFPWKYGKYVIDDSHCPNLFRGTAPLSGSKGYNYRGVHTETWSVM